MTTDTGTKTSSMDSSFPVLVPYDPALFLSSEELEKHTHTLLSSSQTTHNLADMKIAGDAPMSDDGFTMVSDADQSTLKTDNKKADSKTAKGATGHPFMDALLQKSHSEKSLSELLEEENKMYTQNYAIAHKSTNDRRLDLFTELEKTISGPTMKELLEASWAISPEDTLRIVWNARSIHLGKGDRQVFYRALGWMKEHGHEKTVLQNLRWAVRPVIEKKVKKDKDEKDTDGDAVMVGTDGEVEKKEELEEGPAEFDVPNGVAHGYWKDLLNLLVLEVEDAFRALVDPDSVLAVKNKQEKKKSTDGKHTSSLRGSTRGRAPGFRYRRGMARGGRGGKVEKREERKPKESKEVREARAAEMNEKHKQEAKERRHQEEARAHEKFTLKFNGHDGSNFYRALHLLVASLFAEQLRKDMDLLKAGKKKDLNHISHAAKWAPSLEGFHDKHTFIASSIAEILFPQSDIGEEGDTRETYLKRARERYRKFTLSPLRKALEVVERDISAETFDKIKYERVPSVAMDKNKDLFMKKDFDHFETYIDRVAQNKGRISGAVLLPSVLVHQVRQESSVEGRGKANRTAKGLLASKLEAMSAKVVNEQWKSLVQRIKDSGKLQDSIAVCDVSGSMSHPAFKDQTCPMDSSIGLSLLISEITKPPFGGTFISFSENPKVHCVGGPNDARSFTEKVQAILQSDWGYSTHFLRVFEDLILPIAIKNNLRQEDMVKQVFVFSDMQFNAAQATNGEWDETTYERLQRKYKEAGYELPKLIFWNLAARAGYDPFNPYSHGDETVPKPVTSDIPGTAIVSGYSQGQLKMFLDEGMFEDEEEEEVVVDENMEEEGEEEKEGVVGIKKTKKQADPMAALKRAIGHKAYAMLKVVD